MLEIRYLADHRHHIPQLAQAIFLQWEEMYTFQKKTVATLIQQMEQRALKEVLPLTLIALENNQLRGSITIKTQELEDHDELSPWIAGVYVFPPFRQQGIGRTLLESAERVARERFGVQKLFLYTATAQELYEKSGYTVRESYTKKEGTKVVIMEKNISPISSI